ADVARGFVTVGGALEDYGVVLDPVTLDVDKTATDEGRRRRARNTALIDRGPGFEEAESRWRSFRASLPDGERADGMDADPHPSPRPPWRERESLRRFIWTL